MTRIKSSSIVKVKTGNYAGQVGYVDGIHEVESLPIKVVFYNSGAIQYFTGKELRLV